MTHEQLVRRAALWLRKTERCRLVLTDRGHADERADAIGWPRFGEPSILVEVKVSRADFLRDSQKKNRVAGFEHGLGNYRWYLAPRGLIDPVELPQWWGLLEPKDFTHPRELMATQLVRRRKASRVPANEQAELKCVFYQCAKVEHGKRIAEHRLEYAQNAERSLATEVDRLTTENARLAGRILALETDKGVLQREVTDLQGKARHAGWGFNGTEGADRG